MVSKFNTTAQIVFAAVVLGDLGLGLDLGGFRMLLVYIVGISTLASAGDYIVGWVRHMAGAPVSIATSRPEDGDKKGGVG